jgi:hypothetical protein
MLLFYCTDCKEIITANDSESTDQIVDKLGNHVTNCPRAMFTCEGTSGIARWRLGGLRSLLESKRLADKVQSRLPV